MKKCSEYRAVRAKADSEYYTLRTVGGKGISQHNQELWNFYSCLRILRCHKPQTCEVSIVIANPKVYCHHLKAIGC
jgi:hypothetical protein